MLILARKLGESIVINDNIIVRVLGVKGNAIRFGIEAPEHINIVRSELLEKHEKVA